MVIIMTDSQNVTLLAAIALAIEGIRPNSMMAKVLEAMVNRIPNGLPPMTYDLEVANAKYAESGLGIEVPSMWELIGLDLAPFPNLWHRVEYAHDNAKAIRNAVYSLKDWFEDLGNYTNEAGEVTEVPISLFVFNKHGEDKRDTNVVTADPAYCRALSITSGKARAGFNSRFIKTAHRYSLNGRSREQIVESLASFVHEAANKASLPGLGKEIRRLEKQEG